MIDLLKNWMTENYIDFKFVDDDVVEIEGAGKFFVFDSGAEPVFDEEFGLNLHSVETDYDELLDDGLMNTIYKFGDIFYYTSNESEKSQMNPLQSVGKAFLEMGDDFAHLGIHGFRELLNGSGQYEDYAKKAKFLGYKALGIAEHNTLAGTLIFQNACKKNGIKPILGITIDVVVDEAVKQAKLYVKNEFGWKNVMNISNIINNRDHEKKSVELTELLEYGEGLYFVFSNTWIPEPWMVAKIGVEFEEVYYQLDTTEYSSDTIDKHYLGLTAQYFKEYGFDSKILKPILISDSYYVHKTDSIAKKYLNLIGSGATHLQSKEQFFRPVEYHYDKFDPLFKNKDFDAFEDLFFDAVERTMQLSVDCDFEINTDFLNMPEYELSAEEKKLYKDKYELFDAIIDSNWDARVPEGKDDEYQDRLDEEFRVIDGNGFLDYFLINWDWLKFCKENNIYVGVARGSAGGSVLSYLLSVTNIDAIEYDLLFERFLNEGRLKKTVKTDYLKIFFGGITAIDTNIRTDKLIRIIRLGEPLYIFSKDLKVGDTWMGMVIGEIEKYSNEVVTAGSPPDIDSDVESSGRQQVKEYLERRYGKNRVFSIGTFTSLGIKSAISDTARMLGIDVKLVKVITKMITQKEVTAGFGFSDFFAKAMTNKSVKKFIQDYPELLEIVRVVLGNSKSPSVHAAGVIITPKYNKVGEPMNAWDWVPVKQHDDMMVSEWEGQHLESAGMLKLDLLGTTILDKIHSVIDSACKVTGDTVDFHDIYTNKLKDRQAFDIFTDGFTQNVFQFASPKMTKFIQSMEPNSIEDIYAANALFRPATMNLGYHEDYVEMKHGRKDVEYDWGLEEITKETYGIMVYQEQMMKAVQKIGSFSLQEADAVRKAMGKKNQVLMDSYKDKFVKGAVGNGCDELEALKIWNKIEQGASYGFNKSHAAAYGLESYVTAWLKAKYPVHFYTMSLEFSDDDDRPLIISEINDEGTIEIAAPNVNTSGETFVTDFEKSKIYWALKSIKQVGDVATSNIVRIRGESGEYESLENFIDRTKGQKVNKTTIENLILSGAFDEIENIGSSVGRFQLIKRFYVDHLGIEVPKDKYPTEQILKVFFWNRIQNELSGLGNIEYKNVYASSGFRDKFKSLPFLKAEDVHLESKEGKFIGFAATLADIKVMTAKKSGRDFAKLTLQCNDKLFSCVVWMDMWEEQGERIKKNKGSIIVLNAKVSRDDYSGGNQLCTHNKTIIKFF
jgi:DNA polymerase-3 subunit alpha